MKKSQITVQTKQQGAVIEPALHGQFIEHLGTCIDGGIWVGNDSEKSDGSGLRKDIVDALAALEPPIVRWPGGCFADTYHWRDGIGPSEERPITFNSNFGTNREEYNQFGTHEFMDLCQKIKAKPWLNINLLSGTVEEMVSWAQYCNSPHTTSLAKQREKNGSKAPFNVEYWGIGNEAWAGGGFFTAEGYADAYRRYASSFPSFPIGDGSNNLFPECLPIKMIAVGPDGNKPLERVQWTTRFFRAMEQFRMPRMDAYDLHFYNWNSQKEAGTVIEFNEEEWYRLLDGALELESVITEQYELIQRNLPRVEKTPFSVQPKVDLIVGEWGNWHPFDLDKSALWQQNTVRDMLSYALTLDIFHHHCDKVKMACLAQSVNVLGSLILTDGSATILTPTYHLFMMYKVHRDAVKIGCETVSDILYQQTSKVDAIHSFASLKEDFIYINVINTDYMCQNTVSLSVDVPVDWVSTTTLTGVHNSYNDKEHPDRIIPSKGPTPVAVSGGNAKDWTVTIEAASVNVMTFKIK